MKLRKLAVVLAVASALVFTACESTPTGDKSARNGDSLYKEQKYTEALDSYFEAQERGVNVYKEEKLYAGIADCYCQLGEYEKSIEYYKKSLGIEAANFEALVNLGVSYRKTGDRDKAMESYETALKYDPKNNASVPLYTSLGSVYIEIDKPMSAINYLEKAREFYPEKADIHAYLAIAYKMAFEYAKSEESLAKAKELGYPKIDAIQEQLNKLN
ncbi:MAG: tetratricopeptide repeat protein [Oscillospiraceae bacterium]|nr:tetratricopeptide repeat protein [Oscillospiraceae bacterium]